MSETRKSQPPLTDPFEIGGVEIANRVLLAPLAGIGNWFVRLQAKRHGAGLAVSEMISSFGLHYRNERTLRELMRIHPDEHPVSVQLFGHDPAVMRSGAAIAAEAGAGAHHRGIVAEELHRDRVLIGVDPHQLAQGALVAVVQAEAGDHLRDREPRPVPRGPNTTAAPT